jgi:hypothetical protein
MGWSRVSFGLPATVTAEMLLPPFAQSFFNIEARPIIGVRNKEWEFIVNPIVDFATGRYGEADFVPAARIARKLDKDFYLGVEYYGDYGKIGNFARPSQQ